MAKKRMTIIDAENEFEKDGAILTGTGTAAPASSLTGPSSILFKYDASVTREIQSKERVWRNRSTILVSTGKVGFILQFVFNLIDHQIIYHVAEIILIFLFHIFNFFRILPSQFFPSSKQLKSEKKVHQPLTKENPLETLQWELDIPTVK